MRASTQAALVVVFLTGAVAASAQTTLPTTQSTTQQDFRYPPDPRPGLAAFYDAIGKGDEVAAFNCWFDDIKGDAERHDVDDLVHHLNREMIATAKFEAALRQKLPAEFEKEHKDGEITPESKQLLACKYTVYRRLAICKWGDEEDDGFPMVLDNSGIYQGHPAVWKLSMQQWHETNASTVGDPMLASGFGVKVKDLVTKDLLAGKYKTLDDLLNGYLDHMKEIEDADAKSAATQPTH